MGAGVFSFLVVALAECDNNLQCLNEHDLHYLKNHMTTIITQFGVKKKFGGKTFREIFFLG